MDSKEAKKTEAQAKKEAERTAKENAKIEAAKAKEAKKAEAQAKKEAERAAKEMAKKAKKEGKQKNTGDLLSGTITLHIAPPVKPAQLKQLEEQIGQDENLRLVLTGGSAVDGSEIIIAAENPVPLAEILSKMPIVAEVNRKGKAIHLTLKAE